MQNNGFINLVTEMLKVTHSNNGMLGVFKYKKLLSTEVDDPKTCSLHKLKLNEGINIINEFIIDKSLK